LHAAPAEHALVEQQTPSTQWLDPQSLSFERLQPRDVPRAADRRARKQLRAFDLRTRDVNIPVVITAGVIVPVHLAPHGDVIPVDVAVVLVAHLRRQPQAEQIDQAIQV
jgi:hypothetical protein